MTKDEFENLIREAIPEEFVRHRLLDDHCFIFEDTTISTAGSYHDFQKKIADLLDVNPRNVAVIGSSKFGWSMSPEKFGAPYVHGESDVDIVIVSTPLFESCWRQVRQAYFNGYDEMRKLHRDEVFSRFIVIKSAVEYSSEYLRELRKSLLSLNKIVTDFLAIEGKAKYRIYCDWSDVELYHLKGLRALQERQANADT